MRLNISLEATGMRRDLLPKLYDRGVGSTYDRLNPGTSARSR